KNEPTKIIFPKTGSATSKRVATIAAIAQHVIEWVFILLCHCYAGRPDVQVPRWVGSSYPGSIRLRRPSKISIFERSPIGALNFRQTAFLRILANSKRTSMNLSDIRHLFDYTVWANSLVMEAADELPDEGLRSDVGISD